VNSFSSLYVVIRFRFQFVNCFVDFENFFDQPSKSWRHHHAIFCTAYWADWQWLSVQL